MSDAARFLKYVAIPDNLDDCWLWTGFTVATDTGPRGRFYYEGRSQWAARVSFMIFNGPLLYQACHTCDVGLCVNPSHLFDGTSKENAQDAVGKGRNYCPSKHVTHCKRGHEYTPENTYMQKQKTGYTVRSCIICRRAATNKSNAAKAGRVA